MLLFEMTENYSIFEELDDAHAEEELKYILKATQTLKSLNVILIIRQSIFITFRFFNISSVAKLI